MNLPPRLSIVLLVALLLSTRAEAAAPGAVYVARLSGVVDPIAARYLIRAIDAAEAADAAALVVVLDTPGGLSDATRDMTQRVLASRVPVVVFVGPSGARAASAGTFLTLAANVAAMAPGTNLGAAHPVALGGEPLDATSAAKAENDAASSARALAVRRGRNAAWAERAVRESVSATAEEARDLGVVDLVAVDLDDLLRRLDGRGVETAAGPRRLATADAARQPIDMTPVEGLLHALLNPNVAFLLINLGFFGLLAELFHPGMVLPGVVGGVATVLGLVALGTMPINLGAAALLVLAFALFAVDLRVTSHGALSLAAAAAFLAGGSLLFSPLDASPWQPGPIEVDRRLLFGLAALMGLYVAVVLRAALAARRGSGWRRGPGPRAVTGVAVTALAPLGIVNVGHEEWSAMVEGDPIAAGESVEVLDRRGLRLLVRRPSTHLDGATGGK